MAEYKHIAIEQVQCLATALFSKWKSWSSDTFRKKTDQLTKADVGLDNVDNKSSEAIRSELTADNVVSALGYEPPKATSTLNDIDLKLDIENGILYYKKIMNS